jgi:cardiolipin synthase
VGVEPAAQDRAGEEREVLAGFPEHTRGPHRARWFATVDEAYAQYERRIDAAHRSVRVETYLMREEGPAMWLRDALLRARARGVPVWLLLDAFGCETVSEPFLQPLRDAGVKVARFNPNRLLRRTFRNHRKLLAVDGEHAIVGGFNIAVEYAGDGVNSGWLDSGVYVGGPVVEGLERSFDALFALAPFTPRAYRRFRRAMRHGWTVRHDEDLPMRPLMSGPGLPRGVLGYRLRRDIAPAREVNIASAYFLPSTLLRRQLYRVARGAGRVRLLLAGPSDVPLARLAAQHLYTRLLARRVRIFEYRPQILHAKVVVADSIVWVGSGNLDRRSLSINYELLLRFDWPELAADARVWFARALRNASMVRLSRWRQANGWWLRLRSWLAWLLLSRIDPLLARRGSRSLS